MFHLETNFLQDLVHLSRRQIRWRMLGGPVASICQSSAHQLLVLPLPEMLHDNRKRTSDDLRL